MAASGEMGGRRTAAWGGAGEADSEGSGPIAASGVAASGGGERASVQDDRPFLDKFPSYESQVPEL